MSVDENDPDAEIPAGDPSLHPVLPPSKPTPPPALPVTPPDPLDESFDESFDESRTAPQLPGTPMPSAPLAPPTAGATAEAVGPTIVATRNAQTTGEQFGSASPGEPLIADRSATRHVPTSEPTKKTDYGLPTKSDDPSTQPAFVRPDLESMGPPTTAVLVGRVLFVIAALLVGFAAQRATGSGRPDLFWPVTISAGVFVAVGVAGLVYWSSSLAANAKRLRARGATAKGMAWIWALPVGWVALSSASYLQVHVDGDLNPLPGVAGVGWVILISIAYARLQGVFRGLSRTPPVVWVTAFPLDAVAFGLLWWRLTSWPSPVSRDFDHAQTTSDIAYGAAALLFVNALIFVWLGQRASNGVFERLGRLEAQHRPPDSRPEWFRAGLVARPPTETGPVRPLIGTGPLAKIVAGLHVLWGLATVALAIVVVKLTFAYSDAPVFLGDELALDDSDERLLIIVGGLLGLVYVAAIVCHGVWAILAAINARRVTVHAPNPATFAIVYTPMPVLVVAGLVIGGTLGYWLVVGGLAVAFFALLLSNQMLMAMSARLGGQLNGFSRWTLCITLVYVVGLAQNLLFFQSVAQLGFYATMLFVQGVLIGVGGVVGYRAMHASEHTLTTHRQVERIGESGS